MRCLNAAWTPATLMPQLRASGWKTIPTLRIRSTIPMLIEAFCNKIGT
jgi:hypothetical protein